VSNRDGAINNIFIMNSDGSHQVNLTNIKDTNNQYPTWTLDGKKITYTSSAPGILEIYSMNPDGSGVTRLINDLNNDKWKPVWRP
jgi:Tol biopolymer transport system component